MRQLPGLRLLLLLAMLAALWGCTSDPANSPGEATGSLGARIVWLDGPAPGNISALQAAMTPGLYAPMAAPAGVFNIRVTVSGADFASIQQTFSATPGIDGNGTVTGIKVGTNRTLTVEGLNAVNTPIYQGQVIGITITAGINEPVTVPLSMISSIPPATPTITAPVDSPHYSTTNTLTLSGACTDATAHTVLLAGDQAGSAACAVGYSFNLGEAGDGIYTYSVTQRDDSTLLISPADTLVWVIDSTAPAPVVLTSPGASSVTSSGNTLALAGTCETGATVNLSGDDTQSTSCVDSAFSFSITETVDSTYNYTLTQTDLAGNISAGPDATQQWVRDSSVPNPVVITTPAASPYYSNTLLGTLAGACNSASAHTVNLTGQETQSMACSGSAFSFTLANPGGDGSYSYTVTQTNDGNGFISGPVTLNWIYDTATPAPVVLTSPSTSPIVSSGTSLTLAGTCEAGATVTLSGSDSQTASCVGGLFVFNVTKTSDGTYTFTLTQTDLAGNISTGVNQQWDRDNSPPVTPTITTPASSPHYSNAAITVTGACTSSSPHTVHLSGSVTDQVACSGGAYSFLVSIPGADGSYNLSVSQTRDATGATSSTVSRTWIVDTTAPATPTIASPSASQTVSSGNTFSISGSCDSGEIVNLTGNDTQNQTCAGGAYTFNITKTVDGTYNFSVHQSDLAGNVSGSVSRQWVRDSAVPATPTISTPGSNPYYSNTALTTISGSCTSTVPHTVTLSGQESATTACSGSAFSFTLANPGPGTYVYNITQTNDGTALTSGQASLTWNFDQTTPASVTITTPASSPITTTTSVLTIAGACESNATVNLTGDDTQSQTCSSGTYSFNVNKTVDNTYNFSVNQTDQAGNTAVTPKTQQWIRDTQVPSTPTITTPASSPHLTNSVPLVISGACTSPEPHTVNLTGQETKSVACSSGSYSFSLTDPGADGSYTYYVSQTKNANSLTSSNATFVWNLDQTTPAAITITNPSSDPVVTAGNSVTISGACETDATVNLTGSDTQSTTCVATAYSFTVTNTLDGTYNYSLTQTDAAGNTSTPATTQQWIRLTNPPSPPTISSPASSPLNTGTWPGTISGACNSTIPHTVNLTGADTQSTACSGSAYSFTIANPGSDGTYSYTVTQTNNGTALTSSGVSQSIILDTANPSLVTISNPATSPVVSTGNNLTISGACETNATVYLTGDDTQSTTCAASAYSFTVNKTVNGTYSFTLYQQDLAGNSSGNTTQVWQRGLPAFQVSPTTIVAAENDAAVPVSVSIDTPPDGDVVVDVFSTDTTEAMVNKSTLTFNAGNWMSAQTVNVSPVTDATADGNQSLSVVLTLNGGSTTDTTGYGSLDPSNVAVTITDIDNIGITVSPTSGLSVAESGTTATFSVVLNKAPDGDVAIDVVSQDISEATVNKSLLTFTTGNWNVPQVVTITGANDAIADGNQTITIALTINVGSTADATGYAALDPSDVSVTNTDDDSPMVTVTPVTGLITNEGGGTATFTVVLNTLPDGDVVIDVASLDSTEVSVDKTTLTFTTSDWFTAQTVTVTGQDDAVDDGNQTVTIALTINGGSTADTTGYAALNPSDVTVLNSDDDTSGFTVNPLTLVTTEGGSSATFNVFLNTQPTTGNVVVINVASQDTTEAVVDKATLTFNEYDWATPQVVTVTGQDDVIIDGNQTAMINLTSNGSTTDAGYMGLNPPDVSVLNTDDDVAGVTVTPTTLTTSESGTQATFTVRLNTQPAGGSSVVILIQSGDTTEVTVDKASVSFNEFDWSTPQTVTVTGVNDALTDGNQVINVALITDSILTTDNNYDPVDPSDVLVTNLDNTPGVTFTPSGNLTTTELGGTDSFTVQLNTSPAATTQVVLDLASSNTLEVTVDKATLTFTEFDWSTPQTVTVTGVDDALPDGSQAETIDVTVNGSTTDGNYSGLGPFAVTVTNTDDEVVEVIVTPTSGLVTTEGGATDTFSLVLSSLPTGDVVINLASSDTTEVTVSPAQVTFTTADWATPQTVTVKGVNDTTTDGDIGATIQITMDPTTVGSVGFKAR